MSPFQAIREECCLANRRLVTSGLAEITFGNVSVLDPQLGVFAIKPSGVAYDDLTPEHMVLLDLTGNVIEGKLRPSSDTPTHRRILEAFTGVCAVVHTHSRSAVSFAQASREIPCLGTTHADYFYGTIPCTRALTPPEIQKAYEWETGSAIVERFAKLDPFKMPAVLVCNHGPFTWGKTCTEAVENALALEIVAELALKTLSVDAKAVPLHQALLDKHYFRKHGASKYYGQSQ